MRNGITLIELLLAITLLALLITFVSTRAGGRLDWLAVQGAAADVTAAFAVARNAAVARGTYVTVHVDSARQSVTVSAGPDTLLTRLTRLVHGVAISSNRDSMAYDPLGHGYGASNQSIILRRGAAAETVVVSRLGRVRYRE